MVKETLQAFTASDLVNSRWRSAGSIFIHGFYGLTLMITIGELQPFLTPIFTAVTLSSGFVALIAKLYHSKVVATKNLELEKKDIELVRVNTALMKAEARSEHAKNDVSQKDLPALRDQIEAIVEKLAAAVGAQAASVYIPVFNDLGRQSGAPRSFAFVAVFNDNPRVTAEITKMKVVEVWTIVGECWQTNAPIASNHVQSDTRHLPSYDAQSGFVPLNTLTLPIRLHENPIGVLQVLNKKSAGKSGDIDVNGFSTEDKKFLANALRDVSPTGLASRTHLFQASPSSLDFLGLRGESILENTVIMHVDLTTSSSLFSEAPLQDAARMLATFSEYIHNEMVPYTGVVERFNGDGALIRFHYVGFNPNQPATNPVVRATYAAEHLMESFGRFKASFWRDLTDEASALIKMRIAICLGPVVAINMGSQQSSTPTVIGPCVNRSAKMVAYAPRDRNVVLVDDNAAKALGQQKFQQGSLNLIPFSWANAEAIKNRTISKNRYHELVLDTARLPVVEFRPLSKFSAA